MDTTRNRSAELAIIGTALQDKPCAVNLSALPEDAFAHPDTAAAHRAIKRLIARGAVPDLITVSDEMRQDEAEPEMMLVDAMQQGFIPSLYGQYEALLLESRKRRILLSAGTALVQGATNPGESMDALTSTALEALQSSSGSMASTDMRHALEALMEALESSGKGRCTTGIAELDRLTGGFRGGKLVVLGARPGVGKTALALWMAVHTARHTGPVLIVSLEMDEAELMTRIAASESGVDVQAMETGKLESDEWDRLTASYGELDRLPIRISTRATTPLQIRREAAAMQSRQGLAMIVVDYIQLMRADGRHQSRYEEVSAISRELKRLAMDLGVPVLALTQFNRNSETSLGGKAERRKPQMSEAKESGSIEQDANMFLIQWAPPVPTDQGTDAWEDYHACEVNGWEWQILSVDKNRQGRTGFFSLAFDKPHMRFMCLDRRST